MLARRRQSAVLVVRAVAAACVLALVVLLAWRGYSFYRLGLAARVEHPDFRVLRPSGDIGHGYGFAGTALILTNLLYLARRRLAGWSLGSMAIWLEMHVFTGLSGAVLIAFHSAFQLRTAIATTTAVSLGIVVSTGLVGRFLYALAPRPDEDRLPGALVELEALLPGVGAHVQAALDQARPVEPDAHATLRQCFQMLPGWRRSAALRRDAVRLVAGNHIALASLSPADRERVHRAADVAGLAASAEVRAMAAGAFLRSWRGLHRFFALLLILTVGVHIGVAWHFGYRWIF